MVKQLRVSIIPIILLIYKLIIDYKKDIINEMYLYIFKPDNLTDLFSIRSLGATAVI